MTQWELLHCRYQKHEIQVIWSYVIRYKTYHSVYVWPLISLTVMSQCRLDQLFKFVSIGPSLSVTYQNRNRGSYRHTGFLFIQGTFVNVSAIVSGRTVITQAHRTCCFSSPIVDEGQRRIWRCDSGERALSQRVCMRSS